MVKKYIILFIVVFFLSACAHGPVYTAKNESDAIKKNYHNSRLQAIYNQNQGLLSELYTRFTASRIDIYREGLGFTDFTNQKDEKMYYLMVKVRPQEITYKEKTSTSDQRFSEALQTYAPKYLKYLKNSDLNRQSIDGITFGVYWAVRDVCDTYGGFIEYVEFYIPKQFINEFLDGKITFQEMLLDTEVLTSLDKRHPTNVKPVFK